MTQTDEQLMNEINHFNNLQTELGYDTTWSLFEGVMNLDQKILTDKIRIVTYECISEISDTFEDTTWVTFTAVAMNGTVGELWKAAESCYQQAKAAVGDWHYFIEDFQMQDNGSLSLTTGS